MSIKVQECITKKIIELLDSPEPLNWTKGWSSTPHQNLISKKPYRGINALICSLTAAARGFSSYWLTAKQAQNLNARVRAEEWQKWTPVVLYKLMTFENTKDDGTVEERTCLLPVRFFKVYNASQCENIYIPKAEEKAKNVQPIQAVEDLINRLPEKPEIRRGGDRAYFHTKLDYIQLPPREAFHSAEDEAAVIAHELSHWSGGERRLARRTVTEASYFGSDVYSEEETVAELCAAFVLSHLGLEQATIKNSAAYIKSWISAMKQDSKVIFRCAAASQKAYEFLCKPASEDNEAGEAEGQQAQAA